MRVFLALIAVLLVVSAALAINDSQWGFIDPTSTPRARSVPMDATAEVTAMPTLPRGWTCPDGYTPDYSMIGAPCYAVYPTSISPPPRPISGD